MDEMINEFIRARPVALVGASGDPKKYGNVILRSLRGRGWQVYAVNPRGGEIEGQSAYRSLAACPEKPALAVLVVPPAAGLKVLDEAKALGVERIWLQPGAESHEVMAHAEALGLRAVQDRLHDGRRRATRHQLMRGMTSMRILFESDGGGRA